MTGLAASGGTRYASPMNPDPARDPFLDDLFSQPAAPYRETHPRAAVLRLCAAARIPRFDDPAGNLVLGAASRADLRRKLDARTGEPLRVFVAHFDHPGFHGVRWEAADRLRVRWHGGGPVKRLAGAAVWLADSENWRGKGRLQDVRLSPGGRGVESAVVRARCPPGRRPAASALFGGLDFRASHWRAGRLLHARAADDLAGIYAAAVTARTVYGRRPSPRADDFLAVLTRAEEVGFVGFLAHLDLGWLTAARRPLAVISLEASRTLPGAEIGQGPVVRLGDRAAVFDPATVRVLETVARATLPGRFQRRLMDGGTCEAAAAMAFGLSAAGLCVPLGNYHNQSLQGGPDSRGPDGPAPEHVHLDDLAGLAAICRALLRGRLPWRRPWESLQKGLRLRLRRGRALLKTRG